MVLNDLVPIMAANPDSWEPADHAAFDAAWSALDASLGRDHGDGAGASFETWAPWNPSRRLGLFPRVDGDGLRAAWDKVTGVERAAASDADRHRLGTILEERFWPLAAAVCAEAGISRLLAAAEVATAIDFCRTESLPPVSEGSVLVCGSFDAPVSGLVGLAMGALTTGWSALLLPPRSGALVGGLVHRCLADVFGEERCRVVHGEPDLQASQKAAVRHLPGPGRGGVFVVTGSADLEDAATAAFEASLDWAGQRAVSVRRVLVDGAVKEAFMNLFMLRMMSVVTGHPAEADVDLGPVHSAETADKLVAALDGLHPDRVLCGGERAEDAWLDGGYYVPPTVLDGLPDDHGLLGDPPQGPCVMVQEVAGIDGALAVLGDRAPGCAAGIATGDDGEAERFFAAVAAPVKWQVGDGARSLPRRLLLP